MANEKRLEVALRFAREGARVYAAQRAENTPLRTGWRDSGKPYSATTDEATIRDWWKEFHGCNFGILTDDELVCLDVDVKNGKDGLAELAQLEAFGPLPPTHTDRTPSGGQHRVFRVPAGTVVPTANPLPGYQALELHGQKASMILAETFFPDGRIYKTIEHEFEFAELPEWLLEMVKAAPELSAKVDFTATWRDWVIAIFPEATWSGDEAQVRCPFHDDTTPSCSVNVAKARFYCHASGCNAHGGLVSFAEKKGVSLPASVAEAEKKKKRVTQSQLLVKLCEDMEFFHSPDRLAYATFQVEGHRETWQLRTQTFKDIASHRFYETTGSVPNRESLEEALGVLRGRALFEGVEWNVNVRLAGDDTHVYLDLGDAAWRCVEVTADGWRITAPPETVRFRRPRGMLELPAPVTGGKLADLGDYLNCASTEDLLLVLAWLVAAMRPSAKYPVLGVNGEQGSAKSSMALRLRELVDPNLATLRASPREEDDLILAATNGWFINLDNVSQLPPWLSDGICRLSTGAGWAKRQLYTDAEEVIFTASRPVVLNGIADVIHRGDLLDRSIIVTLPGIPENARRLDSEMDEKFRAARPALLGGLLDVVVAAIKGLPTTTIVNPPRMADFTVRAGAAMPALGTTAEEFIRAYKENRELGDQLVIEGSLVAQAVMQFIERELTGNFRGNLKHLLELLTVKQCDGTKTIKDLPKEWPRTPRGLSGELRRVTPALRNRGIDVTFEVRKDSIRPISITRRTG